MKKFFSDNKIARRAVIVKGAQAACATSAALINENWVTSSLTKLVSRPWNRPTMLSVGLPTELSHSNLRQTFQKWSAQVALRSHGSLIIRANPMALPQRETLARLKSGSLDFSIDTPLFGSLASPAASFFSHAPLDLPAAEKINWLSLQRTQELWARAYAPYGFTPLFFGGIPSCFGQGATQMVSTLEDYAKANSWKRAAHASDVISQVLSGQTALSRPMRHSKNLEAGLHTHVPFYYADSLKNSGYTYEILARTDRWNMLSETHREILRSTAQEIGLQSFVASTEIERRALVSIASADCRVLEFPEAIKEHARNENNRVLEGLSRFDDLSAEIYHQYLEYKAKA